MSRYTKKSKGDGAVILIILVSGMLIAYHRWIVRIIYALGVFLAVFLTILAARKVKIHRRNVILLDVDYMGGEDFERYVAGLLKKHGFNHVKLTEKYDMGVDIIGEKDGERWGIQVKGYSGLVKASAVRQVVTGLNFYGCSRAMVITNSGYSNVAKKLASTNDCVLVDRVKLADLMS